MLKKLHLMSEQSLQSYIDDSRYLRSCIVGMNAIDVEKNTKYVLESAQINEVEKGVAKFIIDSEGTAHIPIVGRLTNTVTPSAAFNGNSITTYNYITQATISADANQAVKKIRYHVATGGGDADGIEQASNAIFFAKKPTESVVTQAAESGGLWLVSQTREIISTGKLETFGSLGVAAEFKDKTAAEEKEGVKTVILTSTDAPEKRFDIKTDKGQKIVIKRLDEIHEVFEEHVLRGRQRVNKNITSEHIKKNFGHGGSLKAEDALEVGMIDKIQGLTTQTINSGAAMVASTTQTGSISGNPSQKAKMEEKDFLAFLESNPEAKAFYTTKLSAHEETVTTMKTEHETVVAGHAEAIETAKVEASTALEKGAVSMADSTRATKLIATGKYPECTEYAAKCFSGQGDFTMLETMISQSDQFQAKLDLMQVKNNQEKDLKGEEHNLEGVTSLNSPAIKAEMEELRQKAGVA